MANPKPVSPHVCIGVMWKPRPTRARTARQSARSVAATAAREQPRIVRFVSASAEEGKARGWVSVEAP